MLMLPTTVVQQQQPQPPRRSYGHYGDDGGDDDADDDKGDGLFRSSSTDCEQQQSSSSTSTNLLLSKTTYYRCSTCRQYPKMTAVAVAVMVVILIPLIVVLDLVLAPVHDFACTAIEVDVSQRQPVASIELRLDYGSRFSQVEPKSVVCTIEDVGDVVVDVVKLDENEYVLTATVPEDDVDAHAALIWDAAMKKNSAVGEFSCVIEVDVLLAKALPVTRNVHLSKDTMVAAFQRMTQKKKSGEDDREDTSVGVYTGSSGKSQQQRPFVLREMNAQQLELGYRLNDLPAAVADAIPMVETLRVVLPSIEVHVQPADASAAVVTVDGFDATYNRQEEDGEEEDHMEVSFVTSEDEDTMAVVRVTSDSASSAKTWFGPAVDVYFGTTDQTTIYLTIDAKDSFVEAVVGRNHDFTLQFEQHKLDDDDILHSSSSSSHGQRLLTIASSSDTDTAAATKMMMEEEESSALSTTTTMTDLVVPHEHRRRAQGATTPINKEESKANCMRMFTAGDGAATADFDVGMCWLLKVYEGFTFVGDMSLYDTGMSSVVETVWSWNDVSATINTDAVVEMVDDSNDVMNVAGSAFVDWDALQLDSNLVNDGTFMPFDGIMKGSGAVTDDAITFTMDDLSLKIEADQIMDVVGKFEIDITAQSIELSFSDPNMEFNVTGVLLEDAVMGNTTCYVQGDKIWDADMCTFTLFCNFCLYLLRLLRLLFAFALFPPLLNRRTIGLLTRCLKRWPLPISSPSLPPFLFNFHNCNKQTLTTTNKPNEPTTCYTGGQMIAEEDGTQTFISYIIDPDNLEWYNNYSFASVEEDYYTDAAGSISLSSNSSLKLWEEQVWDSFFVLDVVTDNGFTYALSLGDRTPSMDYNMTAGGALQSSTTTAGAEAIEFLISYWTLQQAQELWLDVTGSVQVAIDANETVVAAGGTSVDLLIVLNDTATDWNLASSVSTAALLPDSLTIAFDYITFDLEQEQLADISGSIDYAMDSASVVTGGITTATVTSTMSDPLYPWTWDWTFIYVDDAVGAAGTSNAVRLRLEPFTFDFENENVVDTQMHFDYVYGFFDPAAGFFLQDTSEFDFLSYFNVSWYGADNVVGFNVDRDIFFSQGDQTYLSVTGGVIFEDETGSIGWTSRPDALIQVQADITYNVTSEYPVDDDTMQQYYEQELQQLLVEWKDVSSGYDGSTWYDYSGHLLYDTSTASPAVQLFVEDVIALDFTFNQSVSWDPYVTIDPMTDSGKVAGYLDKFYLRIGEEVPFDLSGSFEMMQIGSGEPYYSDEDGALFNNWDTRGAVYMASGATADFQMGMLTNYCKLEEWSFLFCISVCSLQGFVLTFLLYPFSAVSFSLPFFKLKQ